MLNITLEPKIGAKSSCLPAHDDRFFSLFFYQFSSADFFFLTTTTTTGTHASERDLRVTNVWWIIGDGSVRYYMWEFFIDSITNECVDGVEEVIFHFGRPRCMSLCRNCRNVFFTVVGKAEQVNLQKKREKKVDRFYFCILYRRLRRVERTCCGFVATGAGLRGSIM